ncbi:MAG: M43 family zinc metalloprotease [Bacteroidota bacterium]|nr:M43 family zinc metalloprotease [Bacteroidota bacterium]
MRTYFILAGILIGFTGQLGAQRACFSAIYQQNELVKDPSLAGKTLGIESFIHRQIAIASSTNTAARLQGQVITIPVVVHILYHLPGEDVSDEKVFSQIEMLNECYRRKSADTVNTPASFKPVAADCEIEFQLATSDPQKRSTSGIIHKYTPITSWDADDMMKYSSQMGDDPWDPQNYLNIWVCNIRKVAGYSSIPGSDPHKDGVVIEYPVLGMNYVPGYEMGKTAVHEIGHWLGLKHTWGDANCGDDFVADTPTQGSYTVGCPSGIHISCNNAPTGDMYMNYMDYTNDACVNIFTEGQKERMRALFAPGGPRYSILASYGLNPPTITEVPLPDDAPKWLHPQLYPNPATTQLTLDISYDIRWIGKLISLFNMNGQLVIQAPITSKVQTIDISKLKPGLYFISAKKEDGSYIKQKFVKM